MALTLTVHAAVDFRNQLIGGVLVEAAINLHGILGGDEESGAGPVGVGAVVVVEAHQLCMTMRGEMAHGSRTVTTESCGQLQSGSALYKEAWMMLMKGEKD